VSATAGGCRETQVGSATGDRGRAVSVVLGRRAASGRVEGCWRRSGGRGRQVTVWGLTGTGAAAAGYCMPGEGRGGGLVRGVVVTRRRGRPGRVAVHVASRGREEEEVVDTRCEAHYRRSRTPGNDVRATSERATATATDWSSSRTNGPVGLGSATSGPVSERRHSSAVGGLETDRREVASLSCLQSRDRASVFVNGGGPCVSVHVCDGQQVVLLLEGLLLAAVAAV